MRPILCFLLQLIAVSICDCALFKENLHVVSEIVLKTGDLSEKVKAEWFQIEEYIDKGNEISSMKVKDMFYDENKIYYNDLQQAKFVLFNQQTQECKYRPTSEMPMAQLKKILTYLLPGEQSNRNLMDISLGPSMLLLVIEKLSSNFRYVSTTYDQDILSNLDNYELIIDADKRLELKNRVKNKKLMVNLKILSEDFNIVSDTKNNKPKYLNQGSNLSDRLKSVQSVNIIKLVVCLLDRNAALSRDQNVAYDCNYVDLMVDLDFFIITELVNGDLLGKSLQQTQDFDFKLEPFMQPIGLGCWDDIEGCLGNKRLKAPGLQFSAEYLTTNGSGGLSYVAYDGNRKVLRLDRDERKGIYDLRRKISYHVAEFKSMNEITDVIQRSESCIVLKQRARSMTSQQVEIMENLLGISKSKEACHMGIKTIDHISYNVYEIKLDLNPSSNERFSQQMPLLLETKNFILDNSKAYFMTYYVLEYPNIYDLDNLTDRVSIPKFIELWELEQAKAKRLINRLEFTQFSWALDVEPSDDPDSQDLSQLFNIKACSQDRANQLQLRVNLGTTIGRESSTKLIETINSNPLMIKEIMYEKLSDELDISRLNIIDLNVFKSNPLGLIIDTKIVELHNGIIFETNLGKSKYETIKTSLKDSILSEKSNRHSIDECRLDSLSYSTKNTIAFCPQLTACILIEQDNFAAFIPTLEHSDRLTLFEEPSKAECVIVQFDWARLEKNDANSIVRKVSETYARLDGKKVGFKFRYTPIAGSSDGSKKSVPSEIVSFEGSYYAPTIKTLEPEANSMLFDKVLAGLRYTSKDEEPNQANSNAAYKFETTKETQLKYCQMACQLDEYCQSFSICLRKKQKVNEMTKNDCILSNLQLSVDHVDELQTIIKDESLKEIVLHGDNDSTQKFKFLKDSECNIHPKDTIMAYKMNSVIRIKSKVAHNPKELEQSAMSLDECADMDFEQSLWTNLASSNFTYCPMGSICVLEKEDLDKLGNGQICYSYHKSHLQYYNEKKYTKMSIGVKTFDFKGEQKSIIEEKLKELKVAKSLEGLSLEECARDCNLLGSSCLAFDNCKTQMYGSLEICNLYSVRSAESGMKENKFLGSTPIEKKFKEIEEFYAKNMTIKTKLTQSDDCNHYSLRDLYFKIRVQQLNQQAIRDDKVNQLEANIINQDQSKSDKVNADFANGLLNSEPITIPANKTSNTNHFLLIFCGFLLSCFTLTYGHKLPIYARDLMDYIRAKRSERMMNHRISNLALANNPEI